jgi:hypothetical protein
MMDHSPQTTGLVVLLGIALFAGAVLAGTMGNGPSAQMDTANASAVQSPGAQFAGVVATEGVSLESELHRRTMRISLTRAQTPSENTNRRIDSNVDDNDVHGDDDDITDDNDITDDDTSDDDDSDNRTVPTQSDSISNKAAGGADSHPLYDMIRYSSI